MKQQKPSLNFKLRIIEEVEANSNIVCMEMTKRFGLVSSLLRNIILTKDKKCGVKAAKKRGGGGRLTMKAGVNSVTPTALYFL